MANNVQNKDLLVRTILTVLLGFILFAFIYNIFFGPGNMVGMGMGGQAEQHGSMDMAANTGFNFGLGALLGGILTLLIKLLSLILIIALVVGIWIVIRDYLLVDGEPLSSLTRSLTGNKTSCPKCGSAVNARWDFCPDCGQNLKQSKLADNSLDNNG